MSLTGTSLGDKFLEEAKAAAAPAAWLIAMQVAIARADWAAKDSCEMQRPEVRSPSIPLGVRQRYGIS